MIPILLLVVLGAALIAAVYLYMGGTRTTRKRTELPPFRLMDDHVETGEGNTRREHYLFRLHPKNMEILGSAERFLQEDLLQALLDGSDQIVPSFFILDKTEGLGHVREHLAELKNQNGQYDELYADLIREIDGLDAESAAVERAAYMCLEVRDRSETELFSARLRDCIEFHLADREEWIVVLRNFLLREYLPFKMAEFGEHIELLYRQATEEQAKRKRPRPVVRNAIVEEETRRLLLPSFMKFNTRYGEQNDFLRKVVTIRNYPPSFERDCVLQRLACLENTTLRIYAEPLSNAEVQKLVNTQHSNSVAKGRMSGKAAQKTEADTEQEQIIETYKAMILNNEKMFFITILLEVYAPDVQELAKRMEKIKNILMINGITKDDLIYQQREAFLSMLPFGKNHVPQLAYPMPSQTVAALYPFTSSKKVDPQGLLLGRTASRGPVILDFYLRNEEITSGNALVCGAPGQGKSYAVKKIIAQEVARGRSVFCLDPENEYGALFSGLGCSNIECGIGGYVINPLEVRIIAARDDLPIDEYTPAAFKESAAFKQHLSWLREFFKILFPSITERELNILSILLREHYASFGIGDSFDPRTARPSDYPTFGTLYEYVHGKHQHFDPAEYPEFEQDDLKNILLQLREVYDGSASAIFNGITNVPNEDVINFQLLTLLQGENNRMAAVMFNIMTWVMTKLVANPKQRQIFVVDELYLMLDRKNPVLMIWLRNYIKRDRKYEGVLILCTQNLTDLCDPELEYITIPLLQLPPHKFIFNLGDVDPAILHRYLGLEDHEIALITHSRKTQCLLKSGTNKYYMIVGTLPYEKILFGDAGGR